MITDFKIFENKNIEFEVLCVREPLVNKGFDFEVGNKYKFSTNLGRALRNYKPHLNKEHKGNITDGKGNQIVSFIVQDSIDDVQEFILSGGDERNPNSFLFTKDQSLLDYQKRCKFKRFDL